LYDSGINGTPLNFLYSEWNEKNQIKIPQKNTPRFRI
jgi:hypothetical protein